MHPPHSGNRERLWPLLVAIVATQWACETSTAVNRSPTVQILSPSSGTSFAVGASITLEGTATDPEDGELSGTALAWSSDLDGPLGTGASLTRADLTVGTHNVTLTATDSDGDAGTRAIRLVVNQLPAVEIASLTDGAAYAAGDAIRFAGGATDPEDGPLSGGTLVWTSDVDGELGRGRSFERTDLSADTHQVTLTATDTRGHSSATSLQIVISVRPSVQVAEPASGSSVGKGRAMTFQAAATDAEDGTLTGASLVWTSSRDGQIGTGASVETSSLTVGTHTVTLTATDSHGISASTSVSLVVSEIPVPAIDSPADGATFAVGAEVAFQGQASDPEDGALGGGSLVWSSSLDGELGSGASLSTTTLSRGEHTVTLTATDSDGVSASTSITVNLSAVPVPQITAPADGSLLSEGQEVTFTGSATDAEDGDLTGDALVWSSSLDGELGAGTSVSTTTLSQGAHTIVLTATDSDGASGTASIGITITSEGCTLASPDADGDRLPDCMESGSGVYNGPTNPGTNPNDPDTDDDGLEDGDEALGTTAGLDLPSLGVNPLRQDILLEYDWFEDANGCALHSHRPTVAQLSAVTSTFAASPGTNPDGSTGMNFIHDYGQGGAFTGGNLIDDADGVLVSGVGGTEFLDYKAANFASNREGYFHYVILPHRYNTDSGSSGQAEIFGDDMIVSLQCAVTSTTAVANTIVHELGHNLGLHHGGFEARNWKPNYNSVMNYKYQFPGVDSNCTPPGDGVLDFSHGTRPSLDENSLDEPDGVCGSGGAPWDWNDDGDTADTGLSLDINVDRSGTGDFSLDVLYDFDDWSNLYLASVVDFDGWGVSVSREIAVCMDTPELPPR